MTDWKECKEKIRDIVTKNLNIATTYEEALKSCMDDDLSIFGEDDGTPSAERAEGQNEAWELAEKLFCKESDELKEIFIEPKEIPIWNVGTVISRYTYAEAAEKVKAWEDSNAIKVGDVVRANIIPDDGIMVVVEIRENDDPDSYNVRVLYRNLRENWYKKSQLVKTGRTLPVSDWLRQIGGKE